MNKQDSQTVFRIHTIVAILIIVALAIIIGSCPAQRQAEPKKEQNMQQSNAKQLSQYVIYKRPKDHPHHFVVREWLIGPGTATPGRLLGLRDTLEDARKLVPAGTDLIPRFANDDPVIEEVWM